MPKQAASDRLETIAAVATRVFGRLGYRRARTADIAAEAGISNGSLFTYVDSKEALFHLVFVAGFGVLDDVGDALPLRAPAPGATLEIITKGLRTAMACPASKAAAGTDDPDDVRAELAAVIEEHFRGHSRIWPLLAVIERSAADLSELENMYFQRGRRQRIDLVERYVARRVAGGHFRSTVDSQIAARWLIETVTWFAWHRREDRDAALYEDERGSPASRAWRATL